MAIDEVVILIAHHEVVLRKFFENRSGKLGIVQQRAAVHRRIAQILQAMATRRGYDLVQQERLAAHVEIVMEDDFIAHPPNALALIAEHGAVRALLRRRFRKKIQDCARLFHAFLRIGRLAHVEVHHVAHEIAWV